MVGKDNGGTVNNSYYDIDNVTINGAHHVTLGGLYHSQYQDWLNNGRSSLSIASYLSQDGQGYYTLGSLQNLKDMLPFVETAAYKFRLTSDLDLTAFPGWHIPSFSAQEFSGSGHTLSNLSVAQSFSGNVGFIGTLASGSAVTNLGLVAVSVAGSSNVGSMVGTNGGTINNSFSTGSVSGTDYVGGLVGTNSGVVSNSYSAATVSGSSSYVGGLVGNNNNGSISNSYATGSVTGAASWIGGLVGGSSTASLGTSDSYWNTQTSGQAASAEGTPLTTAQMKQMASFSGWDVANAGGSAAVWRIYEGLAAPLLRSFLTPLTVTADSGNRTYDGTTAGLGVSYSILPNANLLGTAAVTASSKDVGNRTLTGSGLYSNQQGYDISYVNGTLTINTAPLTITANAASKTYDGTPYAGGNGVAYSGFVNGETAAVLGGALAYGGNAQGAVNAGSYVITPSGRTATNYTINFVDGVLTIDPAVIALGLAADNKNKTYGGADPALTWQINTGALQGGDSFSGSLARDAGENVGSYAIRQGTLTAGGNYAITFTNGVLSINKAPLTVTANAASKTYDGLAFGGGNGVAYSGFVNGETHSVLGGTLDYAGSSQGARNAGSYAITPTGLTAGNYQISFVDVALTINKAPLTVTANAASKTYDGLAFGGGNGVAYSGFVNGETGSVLSGSLDYAGSSQGARNAGSYAITPTGLTAGNYQISFVDGALTISPVPLTVTADAASKTYDGNPYVDGNGVSYAGFVNGETAVVLGGVLAYGGNAQGAVNAGSYVITPSGRTAGNYTISFVDGVLTIRAAPPDGGTLARIQDWRIETAMTHAPEAAAMPMATTAALPQLDVRADFIALPAER